MSIREYLESEPLSPIVRYHSGTSRDSVAFSGTLRKHPYDENKCLLISYDSGKDPAIFEFRIADITAMEELPSAVDDRGMSRPLIKLWVKKGSYGIRYEPFEVDEPLHFHRGDDQNKDRFLGGARSLS